MKAKVESGHKIEMEIDEIRRLLVALRCFAIALKSYFSYLLSIPLNTLLSQMIDRNNDKFFLFA